MSERMPVPNVLDEVREITPETDQKEASGDELVEELFPGAKVAEETTQDEKKKKADDIEFSVPANTATEFAPPQLSVGEADDTREDLSIDREMFRTANEAFSTLSAAYEGGTIAHP